jgi:hypothetical protein
VILPYRFGLVEGAGLSDEELWRVLVRMQVPMVTERFDRGFDRGFYDVVREGDGLRREPSDEGVVDLLATLWAAPHVEAHHELATYAELCVLVPGGNSADFHIARAIAGVPGWAFKDLDVAVSELTNAKQDRLEPPTALLSLLRRASNLNVVVVFGERARPQSAFGEIER